MVGDLFHVGHIKLIKKVHDLGYTVVVGVHSDQDVEMYKRTPVMTLEERAGAVQACRFVTDVIKSAPVAIDESFLDNNDIDMVFHGHTPAEDDLYYPMFRVPLELGKFTRTERTEGISTTMLIDRIERVESNAIKIRVSSLHDALQTLKTHRAMRVMETHNGISGIIADTASISGNEFDALWSSSLTASVSKGKPDIEVVDTSMRLQLVRDTMEVTQKPMIYDADTGGQPEILRFTVRALEDIGVSACIIEDKCGLKQNSLFGTTRDQNLEEIGSFCAKIAAATSARSNKKFMVIARIEALISGAGEDEALKRAAAYIDAGADAIMIHSSQKTFDEIMSFMSAYNQFEKRVPVVAVPSTYYTVTEADLFNSGIAICIYANHMLRAAYPRMQQVAEGILRAGSSKYVQNMISPVKSIINLLPNTGKIQDLPVRSVGPKMRPVATTKVDALELVVKLRDHGVKCFFGVPDSVLKSFCYAVEREAQKNRDFIHVTAANEGAALTTAAGWHLATGDVPIVYCQNSGFGNMVNPLMSLFHEDAYSIPAVLLIGWRGEPGVPDEPQHRAQGRQMVPMLEGCDIPVSEMPMDTTGAFEAITNAMIAAHLKQRPVAVLVHHKTFIDMQESESELPGLSRATAIAGVMSMVEENNDFVVSTTGYTSRELYRMQMGKKDRMGGNFYMAGSMGHALSIAQGVALAQPQRRVWCIDGDGALLMQMGSLVATMGLAVNNLVHVVLNNSCHESVGGQCTAASQDRAGAQAEFSFVDLAKGAGYLNVYRASTEEELVNLAEIIKTTTGSFFLEIITRVHPAENKALPRPKETLIEVKNNTSAFLRHTNPQD